MSIGTSRPAIPLFLTAQPRLGPRAWLTETKAAFKTTEFVIYLVAVAGVLISSYLVGDADGPGGDVFLADKAWFYITLLTIGYLISRGLAKSGSRHHDA